MTHTRIAEPAPGCANPYNTVGEGVGAAGNGTTISIRSATYAAGAILLNKRGTIAATGGTVIIQ